MYPVLSDKYILCFQANQNFNRVSKFVLCEEQDGVCQKIHGDVKLNKNYPTSKYVEGFNLNLRQVLSWLWFVGK